MSEYRSHTSKELHHAEIESDVSVCGHFVGRVNDADMDFELADRTGLLRVSLHVNDRELLLQARSFGPEDVLCVKGWVVGQTLDNPRVVEVRARELERLSEASALPFLPRNAGVLQDVDEAERHRHRHLMLRRSDYQARLKTRSEATFLLREAFRKLSFVEIETPLLTRFSDDGIGAFVVPSGERSAFALPVTTQAGKQALMASGVEKYMQLARCFRAESKYGAHHQPEYTVLDIEQAYCDESDIFEVIQNTFSHLWLGLEEGVLSITRLPWSEALDRYGSENPDLRYGLPIMDGADVLARSGSAVISSALSSGGSVRGIRLEGSLGNRFSPSHLKKLGENLSHLDGVRLSFLTVKSYEKLEGPLAAGFDEGLCEEICEAWGLEPGEVAILIVGNHLERTRLGAGLVRQALADYYDLISQGSQALCWIYDIPFFAYDVLADRHMANRHVFTQVHRDDAQLLDEILAARAEGDAAGNSEGQEPPEDEIPEEFRDAAGTAFADALHSPGDPGFEQRIRLRSQGYELVLNGQELGTGSIRNHDLEEQKKIFELLGYDWDIAEEQFAASLQLFGHGLPPHGGISIGFDRLLSSLCGVDNIADVVAFPKDMHGRCFALGAPSSVQPAYIQAVLGTKAKSPDSDSRGKNNGPGAPIKEGDTPETSEPEATFSTLKAAFSVTPNPPSAGDMVQFIDRSEALSPIVDVLWSCSPLRWRSTQRNPRKRFMSPGSYPITLTIRTQAGEDAQARLVLVVSRSQKAVKPPM